MTFFSFNPDASGTAEDLASRLGRKTEDIEEALTNLAGKKLLKKDGDGPTTTFEFSPSEELLGQVKCFCEALEDRDKRLEILAKLLRMKATN